MGSRSNNRRKFYGFPWEWEAIQQPAKEASRKAIPKCPPKVMILKRRKRRFRRRDGLK